MYFIVSWDISAVEPRWSQINEQMQNCFKTYPQIRPVNTFYMVKVTSGDQYNAIHDCLLNIAQNTKETIHFIMSPLLTVKGWKGYLPKDRWPKISELTS